MIHCLRSYSPVRTANVRYAQPRWNPNVLLPSLLYGGIVGLITSCNKCVCSIMLLSVIPMRGRDIVLAVQTNCGRLNELVDLNEVPMQLLAARVCDPFWAGCEHIPTRSRLQIICSVRTLDLQFTVINALDVSWLSRMFDDGFDCF